MIERLTAAISHAFVSDPKKSEEGEVNVVQGLFAIADGLHDVATQLKYLGNGDAATSMGAIETFGERMGQKFDALIEVLASRKQ